MASTPLMIDMIPVHNADQIIPALAKPTRFFIFTFDQVVAIAADHVIVFVAQQAFIVVAPKGQIVTAFHGERLL